MRGRAVPSWIRPANGRQLSLLARGSSRRGIRCRCKTHRTTNCHEEILPPAIVAAPNMRMICGWCAARRDAARAAGHVVSSWSIRLPLRGCSRGSRPPVLPVELPRGSANYWSSEVAGASTSPQYWQVLRSRSRIFCATRPASDTECGDIRAADHEAWPYGSSGVKRQPALLVRATP